MKKIFIFIFILNLIFIAVGQTVQDPLLFSKVLPPSPTASSLGQYGDIPVSNYTGIPNINIPLFNVKSGKLELPLSLSYHASGVKVAEEASWVGLGWSLNAGGAITRQINGEDDLDYGGYVSAEPIPEPVYGYYIPDYNTKMPYDGPKYYDETYNDLLSYTSLSNAIIYEKIEQYHAGMVDAQPDNFYYNFFGYSGRLIIKKQSGIITATAVNQTNLIFKYVGQNQWEVTDDKGWKYYFSTSEISRSSTSTSNIPIPTPTSAWSEDMVTAWYLDRAVTLDGEEIIFQYNRTGRFVEGQPSYNEINYDRDDYLIVNGKPGYAQTRGGATVYQATKYAVDEVYLQRINFSNGYLVFSKTDRKDRVKGQYSTYSPALTSIALYNPGGILIKNLTFKYDYFNPERINTTNQENYLRLKLTEIQEGFLQNGIWYYNRPYVFKYNNTSLPEKNSSSIDYWGYFNGANNVGLKNYDFVNLEAPSYQVNDNNPGTFSSIIPFYTYIGSSAEQNVKIFINGANREPDGSKMKASVLESIKYPTGGLTKFYFEPNQYYQYNASKDTIIQVKATSAGTSEQTFVLSEAAFICLYFDYHNYLPNTIGVVYNMKAELQKADGTSIISFKPTAGDNASSAMSSRCVALDPGTYKLKTYNGGYVYLSFSLEAKYIKKIPTDFKMAGGLRISKIENYDKENGLLVGKSVFSYKDNNKSTGILMTPIQMFYNETDVIRAGTRTPSNSNCCFIGSIICPPFTDGNFNYIVTWANSVLPQATSAMGSPVGYSKVSVSKQDAGGNNIGTSSYYYKNFPEGTYGPFFPGVPNKIHLDNGQLLKEVFSDKNGNKVREKIINYSINADASIRICGVKTYKPTTPYGYYEAWQNLILAHYYYIDAQWWYPSSDTTYIYASDNSNNKTKSVNEYHYDNINHKLLTRTISKGSDESLIESKIIYPSDINTGIYSSMTSLNMLNYPIEQSTLVNNKVTQSQLTTYKQNFNNYVPEYQFNIETNDPLSNFIFYNGTIKDPHYNGIPEVTFDQYNSKGNIRQVTEKNGTITSYLWDSTESFPMAQVKGVNYSQISSYDGNVYTYDSELLYKNLKTIIPNNPKTTSSYDTFFRIYSQTNTLGVSTYYTYDPYGRLEQIKVKNDDSGQKLLNKFQYHYIGQ